MHAFVFGVFVFFKNHCFVVPNCSVPLPEFSTFVLRHVVELIYNGQLMVAAEVKPRIEAALVKLKIKDVVFTNPAEQQTPTPTTKPTMPMKRTPPVINRKHFNRLNLLKNFRWF